MKLTGILLLPLLALPAATFGQSSSVPQIAAVRGMLEENVTNKPVPASGLLVTVEGKNYTSAAVKSGRDGLYYIPNLAPGSYTLKVWADPKSPLSFPITVNKGSLTDIAPVIVAPANAAKPNPPAVKKTASGTKKKAVAAAPKQLGAPAQK
jgi:hypothetical protein